MSAYRIINAIIILNCFLGILWGADSLAEENKTVDISTSVNPFESWFRIQEREENKRRAETDKSKQDIVQPRQAVFNLTGILQGKKNLAIINDEVVGEGDIVEGKKIIQISKKKVILDGETEKIILEIQDEF
jgi:hypothetical protein